MLTRTDDAGLLCVHFQPKSEHREDGPEFNLFKHAFVQDAAFGTPSGGFGDTGVEHPSFGRCASFERVLQNDFGLRGLAVVGIPSGQALMLASYFG